MKKCLALTLSLLLAASVVAPALAQHVRHPYKPQRHSQPTASPQATKDEDDGADSDSDSDDDGSSANDRDDYREGYRDSERRKYVYTPVRRRDPNHYSPYRYRANGHYSYPHKYRAGTWEIGGNLPAGYYSPDYYVDYRHYRLTPPPEGYQWVRIEKDVYLVSEGTGFIRDVLYELFY